MLSALVSAVDTPALGAEPEPVDGDWLVYHLSAEPGTLNPITATDAFESRINSYILESLLERDPKTTKLTPKLAEFWDISDDHLTYTFHLRKDVKWHDGKPFTARDVLYSFERIRDPKVDAAHLRNYYRDVESLEMLDDYTVRFTYKMPYFLALEFCGGLPIVPAHMFKEGDDFNTHPIGRSPVGTGPYKFEKWETGKEITLVRNEDYWGEKPHLMRILFRIITNDTVALQALKRGELDVMGLRPIQWVKQTEGRKFEKEFYKLKYYLPQYIYIGWNSAKPYFNDKRTRTAMTMFMDREGFVKEIMYGFAVVVTGNFYINGPYYNKDIKPFPYDPEGAAALLKEAGWEDHDGDGVIDKDGVPFKFEMMLPAGSKTGEQIATILQEDLKKAGIEMGIRRLEWAVFTQKLHAREYDASILAWSLGWDADPFQVWHSSQIEGGSNTVGFKNEEADEIIVEGRKEFDFEKRKAMYQRFHHIMHEEQPYTFMFTPESLVAVSRRFENVNVYKLGIDPKEWWVPKDKQKYGK